ncbi:TPA: hypothetical protein ACGGS6_003631 [Vibrio cholerae]|uniref:hypothetical protein n=1 Tax=Vibrio cholerae TaxID=666 RepID=UPI0013B420B8|nr:hypothetical protein [Vibrio cholerae]GHW73007.1 hypothetical protein VCSRO103_3585 [Vibrio cholerae]HDZ9127068.1 hypothetical protein [Vibrio cholerae]HDZ9290831.1 hypothetical protein [Vibrio cholerae]
MEEVASVIFRSLVSLVQFIVQIKVINLACYSVGWLFSKLCTLGRYPSVQVSDSERIKVIYIGIFSMGLCLSAMALINHHLCP